MITLEGNTTEKAHASVHGELRTTTRAQSEETLLALGRQLHNAIENESAFVVGVVWEDQYKTEQHYIVRVEKVE